MPAHPSDELQIRRADENDMPDVVPLLRASLNKADLVDYEGFLRWKHEENTFGRSPAWVAESDGRIVGFRTFMRWRFLTDEGKPVTALRAVDTATHPDFQGRGIFRSLTVRGVGELTLEGEGIIFNTPNDQSRPGYLKMGWHEIRQLPAGILPRGPRSLARMVTSRVPAAMFSQPTDIGVDAAEATQDEDLASKLLVHAPGQGFRTDRTPAYLRWRTAFAPLHYRLLLASKDPAEGGIIFRLRRRGDALEAAIIEQLLPDRAATRSLLRRILTETQADYAIGLKTGPSRGLIPFPRQGPRLTARPLAMSPPPASAWTLTLGDIELF